MGYDSEIPHMILCIIFMLIVSLNAATFINVPIILENHHVKPMLGEDENKDTIFEKIRAFLGLKLKKEDDFGHGSSSPPPIEAPSPAPLLPHLMNPHYFRTHGPLIRASKCKIHKQKKREEHQGEIGTRTLVTVPVCGSATFVFFVFLLIWGCKKFRKRRRSRSFMAIIRSNEDGNPQNSVKKVNYNPGSDHLTLILQQRFLCLKNE